MLKYAYPIMGLLVLVIIEVESACPPETQCFGNGDYNSAAQSCHCYSRRRTGLYTGECCESIGCKPNATCKHGYCGPDGLTCSRCHTGWNGTYCEKLESCFPWFPCKHGSCIKSRMKCECEPGWVGDLCDRSLCKVNCTYGACPNDPKKCECYENFLSPETGCDRSYCAHGWECKNGGYCIDLNHCVCPPHYSGLHCETISECSVTCPHGRCNHRPDVCECETNWGPEGKCDTYTGPCLNCSSVGGTCEEGPNTCKCKPGYMGPQCADLMCDGCDHGSCRHTPTKKHCTCDFGWSNQVHVPGFDLHYGPCNIISYCTEPCVHGTCPNDPYTCECNPPYVGTECDVIQCPKCCPPQTCDCSDVNNIKCLPRWHHDCCLLKSCFRGDTLVHTANGLVPIEEVKEGDMVVTRHEGDDPSASHLRRVDQVRKRLVPARDLVVFRMNDEDIWVTPDHQFFEVGNGSWISAGTVKLTHSLHALKGKAVKLQHPAVTPAKLYGAYDDTELIPVYDLSVDEYDRYSVGKEGLLAASCNHSDDMLTRDKQVWGEAAHPKFLTRSEGEEEKESVSLESSDEENFEPDSSGSDLSSLAPIVGVLAAICLLLAIVAIATIHKKKKQHGNELESLITRT